MRFRFNRWNVTIARIVGRCWVLMSRHKCIWEVIFRLCCVQTDRKMLTLLLLPLLLLLGVVVLGKVGRPGSCILKLVRTVKVVLRCFGKLVAGMSTQAEGGAGEREVGGEMVGDS